MTCAECERPVSPSHATLCIGHAYQERSKEVQKSTDRYRPIDEILNQPIVRVLRRLRWFDWISLAELFDALDVEVLGTRNGRARSRERDRYSAALEYAVRSGLVERGGKRPRCVYRITGAGRTELRRRVNGYDLSVANEWGVA